MKRIILFLLLFFSLSIFSQIADKLPTDKELLESSSKQACLCIDSISISNKTNVQVSKKISECINKQTTAYQLAKKLSETQKLVEKTGTKEVNINLNINEDSNEFKTYYYELERELKKSCESLNSKIKSNEKLSHNSISDNEKARNYYNLGIEESNKKDPKKALDYFYKAVKEDHDFPFAWDNIGYNNRVLGNYDKALEAYQTSLKIDPTGKMPLQNIPIVYKYKKEYQKAIDSYLELKKVYLDDPEVDYGIGVVYLEDLKDNEKALNHICKAYKKYAEMKSPYRSEAEQIIGNIYQAMIKDGKKEQFLKILADNNIEFK